jgi:hypothetical protein
MVKTYKTHKTHHKKTRKTKGGNSPFPQRYFNPSASEPSANAGQDLLGSYGNMIRQRIQGGMRKTKKMLGGFVPTVMEGFVSAASKYIVPIALFGAYKLVNRAETRGKKSKKSKNSKKGKRS